MDCYGMDHFDGTEEPKKGKDGLDLELSTQDKGGKTKIFMVIIKERADLTEIRKVLA